MGIHATLMLAPGCSPCRPEPVPDAVTDGGGGADMRRTRTPPLCPPGYRGTVSHHVARSSGPGYSHLRLGRSQVAGHLVWLAASPCARLAEGSGLGCPAWAGRGEPCHPGSGPGRRLADVRRRSRACRCRSARAGRRDSAGRDWCAGGQRDHHRPRGVCPGGAGHALIGGSRPARQLPGSVGRPAGAFQVVVTGLLPAVLPGGGRFAGTSSRAWPGRPLAPGGAGQGCRGGHLGAWIGGHVRCRLG